MSGPESCTRTRLDHLGDHGGGLLQELSGGQDDRERGPAGLELEPLGGGWAWSYGSSGGIAEGLDEALLAVSKAIGERHGERAGKLFIFDFARAFTSPVSCGKVDA